MSRYRKGFSIDDSLRKVERWRNLEKKIIIVESPLCNGICGFFMSNGFVILQVDAIGV